MPDRDHSTGPRWAPLGCLRPASSLPRDAIVLAVQAADRRKRIHELAIATIAIAPICSVCQLQHPASIPIEDRGCECIPQPRPAAHPAIHGEEDRLHTLLLAERTAAIDFHRLWIQSIKEFLDLGQYVITLRAQPAVLTRTPGCKVVQRALEAVNLINLGLRVDVDSTIQHHPADSMRKHLGIECADLGAVR